MVVCLKGGAKMIQDINVTCIGAIGKDDKGQN